MSRPFLIEVKMSGIFEVAADDVDDAIELAEEMAIYDFEMGNPTIDEINVLSDESDEDLN